MFGTGASARGREPQDVSGARRRPSSPRFSERIEALQYGTCPLPAEYEFGPGGCFVARVASDLASRRAVEGLLAAQSPLPIHDLLPGTTVLLVESGGRPVGCAAAYLDGPLGLPMERSWPRLLDPLRSGGRRLAEISAVAVSRELHPSGIRCVVMQLLKLGCLAARRLGRATDMVAVLPERRAGLASRLGLLPLSAPRDGELPVRMDLGEPRPATPRTAEAPCGRRCLDDFMRYDAEPAAAWLRARHRPLPEVELSQLMAGRRWQLESLSPELRYHLHEQYLAYELGQCQDNGSAGISEADLLA